MWGPRGIWVPGEEARVGLQQSWLLFVPMWAWSLLLQMQLKQNPKVPRLIISALPFALELQSLTEEAAVFVL